MPLGNGDIGLNVWTEDDGAVLFYIGKTDAWAEATAAEMSSQRDQLVKLARVRVRLEPDPFAKADDLRQTLDAATASWTVSGGGVAVRLWVDANQPVIHGEVTSPHPVRLSVSLDPWRTEPKDSLSADVVVPDENEQIVWYHRNAGRDVLPQLVDRTFGGSLSGPGLERDGLRTMQSVKAGENPSFTIAVLTRGSGSIDEWRAELEKIADRADRTPVAEAWRDHTAWWGKFWQRSYIRVSGSDDAQKVTDGYAWQRYLTACAGRGDFPIKFNGSIFVTDNPGRTQRDKITKEEYAAPMNADERHWGARYWFQNTRPMYWPRLAAGDYDLMMPFFRMFRDMLPLNEERVREFYGHGGAYFRETAPFWGDLVKVTPDDESRYTRHYYLPILETAAMMLAYYEHTEDNDFARDYLVPVAAAGLQFYDGHFPRGSDGMLRLEPVNSLEQFWKVADPTPDLAALLYLIPRLVALPDNLAAEETKQRWRRLLGEVPAIPVGTKNGRKVILPYPGEQTTEARNTEVPEMYAVYPFPLYGVARPDLPLALDTFAERDIRRTKCWHQDPVWAACLGLADEARRDVIANFTNGDPRLKFPAFWEKGHDYAPDQDNGGNAELALQWMLMQPVDDKILLLPAWPRDWNADFKLHAPQRTVVEGRVENGKLVRLEVTLTERRKDVITPDGTLP